MPIISMMKNQQKKKEKGSIQGEKKKNTRSDRDKACNI